MPTPMPAISPGVKTLWPFAGGDGVARGVCVDFEDPVNLV